MENTHAKYAPSASSRWLACPGSINLLGEPKEQEQEQAPSVYAHEGTICHEISADCLRKNVRAEDYFGKKIEGVMITQALVDAIQMYVDEVKSRAIEMGTKGGMVEQKVHIADDVWGWVDAAVWNTEVVEVIDAKFGQGIIVQAEGNTQLMIYAIGLIKKLQTNRLSIPKTVKLVIIQPRTVDPVREHTLSIQELQKWALDTLAPALEKLKAGDTTCVPGEKQCRWCELSTKCGVQGEYRLRQTEKAFAPFTKAGGPVLKTATGGSLPPILDLEAQASLMLSFKHIENWMKAIKEELMEQALAGKSIPFFKMVAGRSNRKWGAEENEIVKFLASQEPGIDAFEKRLKTPPAVEKEIGKRRAKEIGLAEHINKVEGNPLLVPETDKRPALAANVEENFAEFVEEKPVEVATQSEEIATGGGPILINESEEEMSLMQRLKRGGGESTTTKEVPSIIAQSNAQGKSEITDSKSPRDAPSASPPTAPKRKLVLDTIQEAPCTIMSVSKACAMSENSVRMHLRYLHERDGYGYVIYENGKVEITT